LIELCTWIQTNKQQHLHITHH